MIEIRKQRSGGKSWLGCQRGRVIGTHERLGRVHAGPRWGWGTLPAVLTNPALLWLGFWVGLVPAIVAVRGGTPTPGWHAPSRLWTRNHRVLLLSNTLESQWTEFQVFIIHHKLSSTWNIADIIYIRPIWILRSYLLK